MGRGPPLESDASFSFPDGEYELPFLKQKFDPDETKCREDARKQVDLDKVYYKIVSRGLSKSWWIRHKDVLMPKSLKNLGPIRVGGPPPPLHRLDEATVDE